MAKAQVARALDDTPRDGSDVVALAEQLEGLAQAVVNTRELQDEAGIVDDREGEGEDEDEEGGEDEDGGDGSSDVRRGTVPALETRRRLYLVHVLLAKQSQCTLSC